METAFEIVLLGENGLIKIIVLVMIFIDMALGVTCLIYQTK